MRRRAPDPGPVRVELLDTWVDAMTLPVFVDRLAALVGSAHRHVVVNHNVQSLCLLQHDLDFRRLYAAADLIFIDGMPVVGLARLLGHRSVRRAHRIGVLDWLLPVLERARAEGWRVAHLGSDVDVIAVARQRLLAAVPGLRLTTLPGYFDQSPSSVDSLRVLQELRHARPDLLLVGMGMPRQEHWVLHHLPLLPDCPVVTVGGILGYWGGDRPTAPRWLGRVGLEWTYRLLTEWRRLWRRYLLEPRRLARPLASELVARVRRRP